MRCSALWAKWGTKHIHGKASREVLAIFQDPEAVKDFQLSTKYQATSN